MHISKLRIPDMKHLKKFFVFPIAGIFLFLKKYEPLSLRFIFVDKSMT